MLKSSPNFPPQVPRSRAFIDSLRMSKNPVGIFSEYSARMGDTYSFHFGGIQKTIVTTNPEVIQHVLQKNYTNYRKSDIQVKRMGHFLGDGLLTSHGEYWLTQRRLIQEGFHKDKLVSIIGIMEEVLAESFKKIEEKIEQGPLDICPLMNELTFRIVTKTLFSTRLSDEDLTQVSDTISNIQQFIVRQIVQPYLNPWFKVSGTLDKYQSMRNASDKIFMDNIKARRLSDEEHSDMLQTLMDVKYKTTGMGMTDKQILMESMQLIVAGHETSSTSLSWIFYLLTQHPECMAKVRKEIEDNIGDEHVSVYDLYKLEYTVQVIEESLRLYPPFWMVDRMANEDDEVCGYLIPKNSMIITYIYGIHHSKDYWNDPEKFDPERFSKNNAKKHVPFSHIPFGGGPRVCIGANYAQLQMLIILSAIIKKYDFQLAQPHQAEIGPMIILRPRNGIKMKFTKIKQTIYNT